MAKPSYYEFFDALYPGTLSLGRRPLYTTTLSAGKERSFWCYNLREVARRCAEYRNTRRLEVGVALHDSDLALTIAKQRRGTAVPGTIRGCEASVTALTALWAEIRYALPPADATAGRGPGAPPLPAPGLRPALDLLARLRPRPSIALTDAGVVHALWLLDEPWVFDLKDPRAADKAEASELLDRLQWAIDSLAAEHGLAGVAGRPRPAGGLAAAIPVPDSPAGASAADPRIVLETFPLGAGDGRYRRCDFDSLPVPPAAEVGPWQSVLMPRPDRPPAPVTFPLAPIASGCEWLAHCHADRATLGKQELNNATSLLRWCHAPGAGAAGLIHELHTGHPGYDPFDVDKKIAAALRVPGEPITCTQIGKAPGVVEEYCAPCPHFGLIDAPIDLAREDAASVVGEMPAVPDAPAPPDAPALPAPVPAADRSADAPTPGKPLILITARQHEVNDQALAALAAAGILYEHAGALVEIVHSPGAASSVRRLGLPRLRELLSRHCAFVIDRGGLLCAAPPPAWTCAALLARGSWPELPALPDEFAAAAIAVIPEPTRERNAEAAGLLAGLQRQLAELGGAATSRQITAALAAEPDRHRELVAALRCLIPNLDPEHPRAAAALGYLLRNFKRLVFGGRALVEARRTRDGIAWTVRTIPNPPRPAVAGPPIPANDEKEEAAA